MECSNLIHGDFDMATFSKNKMRLTIQTKQGEEIVVNLRELLHGMSALHMTTQYTTDAGQKINLPTTFSGKFTGIKHEISGSFSCKHNDDVTFHNTVEEAAAKRFLALAKKVTPAVGSKRKAPVELPVPGDVSPDYRKKRPAPVETQHDESDVPFVPPLKPPKNYVRPRSQFPVAGPSHLPTNPSYTPTSPSYSPTSPTYDPLQPAATSPTYPPDDSDDEDVAFEKDGVEFVKERTREQRDEEGKKNAISLD